MSTTYIVDNFDEGGRATERIVHYADLPHDILVLLAKDGDEGAKAYLKENPVENV